MIGKLLVGILISIAVAHLLIHYNPDANKRDSWIVKRTKELLPAQEKAYACLDLYPENIAAKVKELIKNTDESIRVCVILVDGKFFVYTTENMPEKYQNVECAVFRKEYVVRKPYLIVDNPSFVYRQIGRYEALDN